ncbi:MAG TPA: heavy metal-binding domain-containing protein, partial [Streptosporangiaceae bacterium]
MPARGPRSGTWGSALTTDEFAALASVGFEPVGQVLGAAVYSAGSDSRYTCPGSFGPLVQTMDLARRTAVGRMATECAELGGHGVVGVRLTRGSFPLGGPQCTAIGTAVRARDAVQRPPVPFTAEVSGQGFAKLVVAGWVPAGLVLGVSIRSRHNDRQTSRQMRWGSGNAEVTGWTELVSQSRLDARRQLENDVERLGADGVVIATMEMGVRQRDCPSAVGLSDHVVETTL